VKSPIAKANLAVAGGLVLFCLPIVGYLTLVRYTTQFGLSPHISFFGPLIAVAAEAYAFLWVCLITLVLRPTWRLYFTLPVICLALLSLLFLYSAAFLSNRLWGDAVSYVTLKSFVIHSSAAKDFVVVALSNKNAVLAIGLVAFLFALCLSLLLAWLISVAMMHVCDALARGSLKGRRRAALLSAGLACVASTAAAAFYHIDKTQLYGDPILSFLDIVHINNLTTYDNRKIAEILKDKEVDAQYQNMRPQHRKNIVLIFSDSVRADHTSVYGYSRDTTPFLRKLYDENKLSRVEIALSICPDSFCGITSTLSSRPFDEISTGNFKITDLLRDVGYKTNFYLSGDHRGWAYLKDYYGDRIDNFVDYLTLNSDSLDDGPLIKAFEGIAPFDGRPNFFYFFLMATHQYGIKSPDYKRFVPAPLDNLAIFATTLTATRRVDGKLSYGSTEISESDIQSFANVYDNGIVQSDANIEKIFAILKDKGYLDDSVVFILADHGDSLGEHDHFGHNRYLYQEDIRIPLLIYDSDGSTPHNVNFATNMDIGPTIASKIGLAIPETWKGKTLTLPQGNSYTIHQTRRAKQACFAVVDSTPPVLMKYVRCMIDEMHFDEMLFDLIHDSPESHNLLDGSGAPGIERYRKTLDDRFGATSLRP
jgi:glucan phosphoethanolaminetransferase (alkaline phosphatase superfamily)